MRMTHDNTLYLCFGKNIYHRKRNINQSMEKLHGVVHMKTSGFRFPSENLCKTCNNPLGKGNKTGICSSCSNKNNTTFPYDYKCTLMYLNVHRYPRIVHRDDIIDYIYPGFFNEKRKKYEKHANQKKSVRRNVSQSLIREGYIRYNSTGSTFISSEEK